MGEAQFAGDTTLFELVLRQNPAPRIIAGLLGKVGHALPVHGPIGTTTDSRIGPIYGKLLQADDPVLGPVLRHTVSDRPIPGDG